MTGETPGGDLRAILERLSDPTENPVARARRMVELQVPPSRRGPGWEHHWREIEAHLELLGRWSRGTRLRLAKSADLCQEAR